MEHNRNELFEELLVEKWVSSPEGQKVMSDSQNRIDNGYVLTHEQMLEKLKRNTNNIRTL